LLLGVSYKPGVGDLRGSPALAIIDLLRKRGADVRYHDSYVSELPAFGMRSMELSLGLADADVAAIVTAHPGVNHESVVRALPGSVDFRGVTRNVQPAVRA